MTHKMLMSTAAAALLAGTVFAAAQNAPAPSGGATERSAPPQAQGSQSQSGQSGSRSEGREQSEPSQRGNQAQGKDQPKSGSQAQGQKDQPKSNQAQGQKDQPKSNGQAEQKSGQSPQQGQARDNRDEGQGRQQGAQQQRSGGASVSFSTEQRTKIRETVLRGGNAPRVTNVDFKINVGVAVPSHVRVVAVPDVIIEVHPEWRSYMYFVVEDQIIIVDQGHKIIAVIDV
jgi:hypothetical protein